jgi:ethanolamine-phosphate phospho-lyase
MSRMLDTAILGWPKSLFIIYPLSIQTQGSSFYSYRYLHENIVKLGKKLTSLFDPKLKICVFLNSGSEANDLALRMAKIHSKKKGIICMEYAYHGALTSLVPISEYKYRGDPSYHEAHIKIASLPHTY